MDAKVVTIWCRHCRIGFVARGAWPSQCLNEACLQPADWSEDNPDPVKSYNLNVNDYRLLRSMHIQP